MRARLANPKFFIVVGATVVWLAWINWPLPAVGGSEPSWQVLLGYAHEQRWQFGTDFVFTQGPWSFLNVFYSYPGTIWPLIIWQLLFKGLVAAATAFCALQLPVWRGSLLLLAAALLLPLFEDVAPVLLVIFLFVFLSHTNPPSPPVLIAAAALLSFLALQKVTYEAFVATVVLGTASLLFLDRRGRDGMIFLLTAAAFLCLFWLAAGQHLTALPIFLRRNWLLASAYSQAMFLDETRAVLGCGILTAAIAVVAIALCISRDRLRSHRVVIAFISFVLGFLIWKQGFVRADGHVQGSFLCALAIGLVLRPAAAGLPLAAAGLLGFAVSSPRLLLDSPALLALHVQTSLREMASPRALQNRIAAGWDAAQTQAQLPQIRWRVGENAVDIFGDDQSIALLNQLRFSPRPVFQASQAYSAALAEVNASFYRSSSAPRYVLARLQTIDNRFIPADDARVLIFLLQNYRAVMEENGWRLLQHERAGPGESFTPIMSQQVRLGESFLVPQSPQSLVQVQINVRPTLLGRLRTVFYKSAELTLSVNDGNLTRSYRLIAPAAAGGFLITPLLRDNDDLRDFFDGGDQRTARTLEIDAEPRFYRQNVTVKFARAPLTVPPVL